MQPERPSNETAFGAVERIVLIGFMGAGKSTVGPMLADRIGWSFADADRELEFSSGSTIAELFTLHGEPRFREMESEIIARLIGRRETVIALGGGAIETPATRLLLTGSPGTCTVFLRAPLDILIERCEKQPNAAKRPVLLDRGALRKRFEDRLPHYEAAHVKVDTDGVDASAVVERLLGQMAGLPQLLSLDKKATKA